MEPRKSDPEKVWEKRFGLETAQTDKWSESAPKFPRLEECGQGEVAMFIRARMQEAVLAKYSRLSFATRLLEACQDLGSYAELFDDPYRVCVKILADSGAGQFRQKAGESTYNYLAACLDACCGQKPSVITEIAEGALDAGWAAWIVHHMEEISKKPMWFAAIKSKSYEWHI